ncbi:DUF3024 domain-containing protein [Prauserella aidingensis]|uniref:DUF3024 domain-containing protein n=1 Tax=Prauserella aidingensis TaxID=387890 RepID=UPI003556BDCB
MTTIPIARLRYTRTTGRWSLYWRDRRMNFHEYKRNRPTKNVRVRLDYLDSHEDPIFWGRTSGLVPLPRKAKVADGRSRIRSRHADPAHGS